VTLPHLGNYRLTKTCSRRRTQLKFLSTIVATAVAGPNSTISLDGLILIDDSSSFDIAEGDFEQDEHGEFVPTTIPETIWAYTTNGKTWSESLSG
jgi:hypothetical protein